MPGRRWRGGKSVTSFKSRLIALYAVLFCANIAVGVGAFVLFAGDSVKLGTALLAYSLGLRHAVDADHIAAIDNVTRKLIQDGKRPITVGFYFALGHSTVVLIAAGLIAFTVGALAHFESFSRIGSVIATATSAIFLFAIAAMNLVILRSVWHRFETVRKDAARSCGCPGRPWCFDLDHPGVSRAVRRGYGAHRHDGRSADARCL